VCTHAVPVLQGRQTPAVCSVMVSVVILKSGGPTAVTLKFYVFWVVNPFRLVDVCRPSGATCCLRNHRRTVMSEMASFSEMSVLDTSWGSHSGSDVVAFPYYRICRRVRVCGSCLCTNIHGFMFRKTEVFVCWHLACNTTLYVRLIFSFLHCLHLHQQNGRFQKSERMRYVIGLVIAVRQACMVEFVNEYVYVGPGGRAV
jgi:hypothetical protein